jgi:hypothetical protein
MLASSVRPGRRRTVSAAFGALLLVALAVPSSPVSASTPQPPTSDPTATIPDGPAQPGEEVVHSWALTPGGNTDPDASGNRSQLTYSADPGTTVTDAVTLYNYSNEQLLFRVYATDALNTEDGNFDLLPGKDQPNDVGSWVSVAQENITVEPGRQVTIPITITIPPEATPGDHVGAVVASSPTVSEGDDGQAVLLDRRTGTRLYLRVNGPVTPELAITGVDTTYHQSVNPLAGRATVQFRIENRGNVRVSGKGEVEVSGPFGLGGNTVPMPDVPELLPGSSMTMIVDVDDVPAMFLASTTVTITPTGDDVTGDQSSSGSDTTFAPPLSLLMLLLAAVLGLLAWRRIRRYRAAAMVPKPGDFQGTSVEREPQHT